MSKYEDLHIEQDFWNDFILEAFEHIDEIETNAMSLEQNPENMEIIHTMFRAFHTIKGLSGFVEHTIIQEIAHKTETMMDYCRKGELKVNTKIVNAILKSSDYIKQLCNDVNAYKNKNLINNVEKLLTVLEELAQVETSSEKQVTNSNIEETEKGENTETQEHTEDSANSHASTHPSILPSEEGLEAFAMEVSKIEEKELQPAKVKSSKSKNTEKKNKQTSLDEKALQSFQQSVIDKLKGEVQPPKEQSQKEQPQKEEPAKEELFMDTSMIKQVSANEDYMKVANNKIDHLVDMMGELIINQSLIEQYVFSKYSDDRQLVTNMSGFLRITRALQNLSSSLRMVSLKPTYQKLTRIARDTIHELGKDVEFIATGEGTEIDRVVAEKLLEPLVHMIKNAISHGIEENPEERIKLNKNRRARVELNAYSKRGKIFIEVKDDGRGINTEVVYQKALEKGLIDPTRTYSEAEIKEFIMLPGFSTAKVVDNISGRGVGMDVVKTQISKTGGKVDIQSTLNEGSTFVLEVPVNHAIMNGTIIDLNGEHFVVPTLNVKEFLQPTKEQWISTKSKRTMIRVRDNIIPIIPLSVFFKDAKTEEDTPLVMILELEQELRALPIKNVINRQEVVVKPIGEEFTHLKYVSGMSILGTGRVSLILDIDYLFRKEVKNNG